MTRGTQLEVTGAGFLLLHLLHGHGCESLVLESRSRAEKESTRRAGLRRSANSRDLRALPHPVAALR